MGGEGEVRGERYQLGCGLSEQFGEILVPSHPSSVPHTWNLKNKERKTLRDKFTYWNLDYTVIVVQFIEIKNNLVEWAERSLAIMAGRVSVLLAGLMIDFVPMLLETGVQVRMLLGFQKIFSVWDQISKQVWSSINLDKMINDPESGYGANNGLFGHILTFEDLRETRGGELSGIY